jgi:hypothetical protein
MMARRQRSREYHPPGVHVQDPMDEHDRSDGGAADDPLLRRAVRAVQQADHALAANRDLIEQIRAERAAKAAGRSGETSAPQDVIARLCSEFGPPDASGAWRWGRRGNGMELRLEQRGRLSAVSIGEPGNSESVELELQSPREVDLLIRWLRRHVRM